jgi:hypothetical protein
MNRALTDTTLRTAERKCKISIEGHYEVLMGKIKRAK